MTSSEVCSRHSDYGSNRVPHVDPNVHQVDSQLYYPKSISAIFVVTSTNGLDEPAGAVSTANPHQSETTMMMDSPFSQIGGGGIAEWLSADDVGKESEHPHQRRFIVGADGEDSSSDEDFGGSSPDSWVQGLGGPETTTHHQHRQRQTNNTKAYYDVVETTRNMAEEAEARGDFEKLRKKLSESSLGFPLDDDSGFGASSAPNSVIVTDDEIGEREEHPSELVPISSASRASVGFNGAARKSASKLDFHDFYNMVNDHLGSGAYASVQTAVSRANGKEYAVKLVDKHEKSHTRSRIIREVEIFKMCRNHPNIVQLIEWFEDDNYFYMVFEKMHGGPLLNHIQRKVCFTEEEASQVTKDIAAALKYLHDRGVAHRDVKPENILCTEPDRVSPVKLCDLDLASKPSAHYNQRHCGSGGLSASYGHPSGLNISGGARNHLPTVHSEPDLASPVGSAEFMAPEVVDAFVNDSLKYDKRCDMWSLGVIVYIMLCGYPPFYGECERENCGWDQGKSCPDCQDNLFHRIQRGEFVFPEEEWGDISWEAKDLITHLLVRDVRQRFTADDVLKHTWVAQGAPKTVLSTPNNLFRNDSTRDVHQMSELFKAYPPPPEFII